MEDGTHLIGGNNKRTAIGAQTYNCMKENTLGGEGEGEGKKVIPSND
jgi:hypothetical protein